MLQTSDPLRDPSLDPFQKVHVLVLGAPELNAVLEVGGHVSRTDNNHFTWPSGHISFEAAHDTVDFVGCKHALLDNVKVPIHQHPQVIILRATLKKLNTPGHINYCFHKT